MAAVPFINVSVLTFARKMNHHFLGDSQTVCLEEHTQGGKDELKPATWGVSANLK